mgnify:CR=1 FL=1
MADIQGWGRGTWSSGSWGEFIPVEVTGTSVTTSIGIEVIVADANISVTGLGSTFSLGTANAAEEREVLLTTNLINTELGSVAVSHGHVISVTGLAMTFTEGDTSQDVSVDEGWGRREWGSYNWGGGAPQEFVVDGVSISSSVGDIAVGVGDTVQLTGVQIGSSTGTITLGQGDQVLLQDSLLVNTAISGASVVGEGSAAVVGPSDQLDLQLGTVIASSVVNVAATGVSMTFTEGTAVAEADASVAVSALTTVATSLGTVSVVEGTGVIVSVTGLPMTFAEGTEVISGNADVPVTGIELSLVLNSIFTTPWANVDTNANNTWTEVDTATIAA